VATKKANKRTKGQPDHTYIAYQGIKKMLFENKILPGQKISYRDLALKLIEISGLVRHEPNRGYFTEPISMKEITEIYDTREIIEISMLPAIMNNLEADGIKKLRDSLEIKPALNQESELYERLKTGRNFHLTLASLSNHKTRVQILRFLFDLLYLKYSASLLFVASERFVGAQHETIFDAVVSQDIEDAQEALKSHFRSVKAKVLKSLGQMIAQDHTGSAN
jgi:DNA-binding GntR family transcriptional regulator